MTDIEISRKLREIMYHAIVKAAVDVPRDAVSSKRSIGMTRKRLLAAYERFPLVD